MSESTFSWHPEDVDPPIVTREMLKWEKDNGVSIVIDKKVTKQSLTLAPTIDQFRHQPTQYQKELHNQLVELAQRTDRTIHHTEAVKIKERPSRATENWLYNNHFVIVYDNDPPSELTLYNYTTSETDFEKLQL